MEGIRPSTGAVCGPHGDITDPQGQDQVRRLPFLDHLRVKSEPLIVFEALPVDGLAVVQHLGTRGEPTGERTTDVFLENRLAVFVDMPAIEYGGAQAESLDRNDLEDGLGQPG